ncbi:MAG: transposase [Alphaproteobacteria bacterium]|mgnify:FL=1|jgi:hypothetical protein|nr:transposase [Alphaproteobacteria bacterium]|tara:strand:- start:63 stop:233 length:171 start_codon:yes stop_codon:yes gene_type:complete
MPTRRRFTADFKARVALEAQRGGRWIQEIAGRRFRGPVLTCSNIAMYFSPIAGSIS